MHNSNQNETISYNLFDKKYEQDNYNDEYKRGGRGSRGGGRGGYRGGGRGGRGRGGGYERERHYNVDPDSNQNLQQFKHGNNKKILMYNPNYTGLDFIPPRMAKKYAQKFGLKNDVVDYYIQQNQNNDEYNPSNDPNSQKIVDRIKEEAKLNEIKNMDFPTLNETFNVEWMANESTPVLDSDSVFTPSSQSYNYQQQGFMNVPAWMHNTIPTTHTQGHGHGHGQANQHGSQDQYRGYDSQGQSQSQNQNHQQIYNNYQQQQNSDYNLQMQVDQNFNNYYYDQNNYMQNDYQSYDYYDKDNQADNMEKLRKDSQIYREEQSWVYNFSEVISMSEKFRIIPADLNPTVLFNKNVYGGKALENSLAKDLEYLPPSLSPDVKVTTQDQDRITVHERLVPAMFIDFELLMNKLKSKDRMDKKELDTTNRETHITAIKNHLANLTRKNYEATIFKILCFDYDEDLLSILGDLVLKQATGGNADLALMGQFAAHLNEYFNLVLEKKHLFRKSMLHKCQEAFHESNLPKDSLTTSSEEEANKRFRICAHILFLGELYIRKLVTDKLFVNCLDLLLDYSADNFGHFVSLFRKVAYLLQDKQVLKNEGSLVDVQYYMDFVQKYGTASDNPRVRSQVDDILACQRRGFTDEHGVPLSTPQFLCKVDTNLLRDCVKLNSPQRWFEAVSYSEPSDFPSFQPSAKAFSLLQLDTGEKLGSEESEGYSTELRALLEQFYASQDYAVMQTGFKYFQTAQLNLNTMLSRFMRLSYDYDLSSIKSLVRKGIKPLLQDKQFKEVNVVKVIWLTLDKLQKDYSVNNTVGDYIEIYMKEFHELSFIDAKKYSKFSDSIKELIKANKNN